MRFAIDTNPLIDWAEGEEDISDCFEVIRARVPGVTILVPPTVLHELGHFLRTDAKGLGKFALHALELIRNEPLLRPINLVPVGHGVVEINAWKLRENKLIPEDEINDSLVLAEASLLECSVLISSDAHLTSIDPKLLHDAMRSFDGSVPHYSIASANCEKVQAEVKQRTSHLPGGDSTLSHPCPRAGRGLFFLS